MSGQEDYYNHFGETYKDEIIACKEPHLWTRDYKQNGKVYNEMKKRIGQQELFIDKYFDKSLPVFDIGCGFGRQAWLLAKKGFHSLGIDTSKVFIDIAKDLFKKHNYSGTFLCADLMKTQLKESYKNILLLDVLEHIIPYQRQNFIKKIYSITQPNGKVIVSLPNETNDNKISKAIKQNFAYYTNREEHPYLIPQKDDVEKIAKKYFSIVDFLATPETFYYVLERR